MEAFLVWLREKGVALPDLVFVCIGTDRSTGDALGPLTGMLLEEAGYPGVIGTLEHPCDSANLPERLREIPPGRAVLSIDGSVGGAVGHYRVRYGPIEPGSSMGKKLPPVGDYSIAAIVCANAGNQYRMLQQAPLSRVWTMSRRIASAIRSAFPL